MIHTIKNFLDFSGKDNKKKFIISIWLGVLNAMANALKIPAIMLVFLGLIERSHLRRDVIYSLVLMVISVVIGIITRKFITVLETEAGYGCCAYKRIEMAEHLRFLPMGYFNNNTLGEISSVITNTMDALANVATRVVMVSTEGMLETLMILVFLFIFDWRIGLIGLLGFVLFLLVNRKLQNVSGDLSAVKDQADREMVSQIVEYLKGIAEIKSYGLLGKASTSFNQANQACCDANTKMEMKYQPWFLLQNIIIRLTSAAVILASIVFYLRGSMDQIICIGMIISAFILFSGLQTYGNLSSLQNLVQSYMDKANDVLSLPEMDIDGEDIVPDNHTIELKNVDFSYGDRQIIKNMTLTIPENKTTALVGPSGGGKTTIAHLVARFWDVDAGSITLGGRNVKEYSFDSLMNNFSFVFQNVYLFKDTIENNIKFGRPQLSHEEVVRAVKLACCDDFISQLPKGYDTVIGEGGASLSGGEKQRLFIARAILKDAPIIILDEATANVDPENEEDLMRAIRELTHHKTVIMIAHRLKTVRHADAIVVINDGQIEDQGTHEALLSRGGLYKTFIEAREHAINWQICASDN